MSGQGRDAGQLQMSDGQCQMYAQQQADQAAARASSASCPKCAALNVATILITRRSAYSNCMHGQGWVRPTVQPSRQDNGGGSGSSGTVVCADRTQEALASGPPYCQGHGGATGVR